MQEEVYNYGIFVYGGPNGYINSRAQIALTGDKGKQLAWVRFHDPGMDFPEDDIYHGTYGDIIRMHLPTPMFQSILDILRNEKPVFVAYSEGTSKAMIGFNKEEVGEGEFEEVPP
jgi:hypothetical protein